MKPHAIMISVPYQGHLNPFVHLALKLASKGFRVTFVHTEYAHHCITKSSIINNNEEAIDIFAQTRDSAGFDIQYKTISDGFPLEYDRVGNVVEFWNSLVDDFPNIVDEFVGKLLSEIASSSSDDFPVLVADTYPGWASKIAEKYNLVNVSFWTEPALVFATTYYTDLLRENGHFPPKDDKTYNIDYIPGVGSISTSDLPGYYRQESETLTPIQRIAFSSFDEVKKADFILLNTVQELEPQVLSSLNQTQPTYSIGPINFSEESIVPKSLFSETDCSKWLNTKPSRSVLYISFGSILHPDKCLIEDIVRVLVLSGVYFLWTMRDHTSEGEDVILKDELKGKGLIVPWCDQREVLSHRAIGGFWTHCGWNSVLESMWYGVPMFCYPIDYDQPTNRKLVVDDWKIGINIGNDNREGMDSKDIAEKIKKVMNTRGEDEMRQEIEKVMKILHHALDEDGSSEKDFNRFVDDLRDKIPAKY